MTTILLCIIGGLFITIIALIMALATKDTPIIPKNTIDLKKHFPELKADFIVLKEFSGTEDPTHYKIEYGFYSSNIDDMAA